MKKLYRKVIRIRAVDSPNVRYALAQQARGVEPTGEVLVPGVLTWDRYQKHLATWDAVSRCVKLDAAFYTGPEMMLFPLAWLDRAEARAKELRGVTRRARGVGIDSAEGGDNTSMVAVDDMGVIEVVSKKTKDTNVIVGDALAFMHKHQVAAECTCFDRGGGGKQHADRLRAMGHNVQTVAFGESLMMDPKRGMRLVEERMDNREERYVYINRRAQMYGDLSELLDPSDDGSFGVPGEAAGEAYGRLRHQLSKMPKLTDDNGRFYLPSKGTQTEQMKRANVKTLIQIIGHSPDEADAAVLAVYGMRHKTKRATAGAV